jgi:hypothetical protein
MASDVVAKVETRDDTNQGQRERDAHASGSAQAEHATDGFNPLEHAQAPLVVFIASLIVYEALPTGVPAQAVPTPWAKGDDERAREQDGDEADPRR